MKVPKKMVSGNKINNRRHLPEVFQLTLLALDGILKRSGIKDAKKYKDHNTNEEFDFTLISSGIYFNLFSEYGVGKILEPLMVDFMRNLELDPEKYRENVFYKEIIRVVPEILPLIREADPKKETKWVYYYGFRHMYTLDDIEYERYKRLKPINDKITKGSICKCNYCKEFRKYHIVREKHIDWYIIDVLISISNS